MLTRILSLAAALVVTVAVHAEAAAPHVDLFATAPARSVWHIDWQTTAPAARPMTSFTTEQSAAQPLHAAAIQHSDAYLLRAKIHKVASFATLPLFATELALGQSLYNSGSSTSKGAHIAVGTAMMGLFMVNTVTGVWNMFGAEGRQDKEGRTLRLVHGLLMMAADVGFVATSMSGPNEAHESRRGVDFTTIQNNKAYHRNLAIASISLGTAGYLVMLFGNHH